MRTSVFVAWITVFLASANLAQAQSDPIDDLQPGHWFEIPNTDVRSVAPGPVVDGVSIGDVANVMNAWSGGAFDSVNDRFFIKGGGHASYGGNEVYSLDLNTLELSRLWGPSPLTGWSDGDILMPDGAPVAAHSVDHIEYIPATGQFCTFTNMPTWAWNIQWDSTSYCLDFNTGVWSPIASMPNSGNYMFSAYDPATGHVFVHGGGGYQWLQEYDPVADQWYSWGSMWSDAKYYFGAYRTAAIDSQRRLFVALGDGDLIAWDIGGEPHSVSGQRITTTGDSQIESADGPGFAYDPTNGIFVAWDGGSDVYVLDPEDWNWTLVPAAPSNTVIPTDTAATYGTYGRFQYIPSRDAFIAVSSVDANMYVYRLDMSPAPTDTTPPTTPVGLTATRVEEARVDLSWQPATDDESGIQFYDVYRDASLVGSTTDTAYADTDGLAPATTYGYYVIAVNNAGIPSSPSDTLSVTTDADLRSPQLVSVVTDDATTLRLTFDEALDPATATDASNYQIDQGLTVTAASLEPDGKTVILTTAPHGQYSLTVNGVTDLYDNWAVDESAGYTYP